VGHEPLTHNDHDLTTTPKKRRSRRKNKQPPLPAPLDDPPAKENNYGGIRVDRVNDSGIASHGAHCNGSEQSKVKVVLPTLNGGDDVETGHMSVLDSKKVMSAHAAIKEGSNFIQACCESDNLLAQGASNKINVVNVTEDDDFTKQSTIDDVISMIKGPADVLFFSAPCTGGSPWQRLNIAKHPHLVGRMRRHWALFRRLWRSLEVVGEHAIAVGAQIHIEWPKHCAYWKVPKVEQFLTRHGFRFAEFDSCQYGLRAQHGPRAGLPIRKSWRIACINFCLPDVLNKKCDGHHVHATCEGKDTLRTQSYTPEIANIIHECVRNPIGGQSKVMTLFDLSCQ
jgi:hypothetical protein